LDALSELHFLVQEGKLSLLEALLAATFGWLSAIIFPLFYFNKKNQKQKWRLLDDSLISYFAYF